MKFNYFSGYAENWKPFQRIALQEGTRAIAITSNFNTTLKAIQLASKYLAYLRI
ncbi:hypothetical protein [Robertkochia solimangrovi]|uniref:hypothetical protein n=1 Tax=Robertkochia solimangrovi TaxID=2213046 RepID=UPI0013A5B335|nr:hypothetical protein [Robertkochia solimangrovi]